MQDTKVNTQNHITYIELTYTQNLMIYWLVMHISQVKLKIKDMINTTFKVVVAIVEECCGCRGASKGHLRL